MLDVIIDTLMDAIKLLPFLFIAFLIIEVIEHKLSNRSKDAVVKAGKFGPVFGSLLGAIPQCGFSVLATNLYVTRILSLGSLIAIYLSTSDEMLPVLLSNHMPLKSILVILLIKVIVGMMFGFIIDLIIRRKEDKKHEHIHDICEHDHCHCENNILTSSLIHTFKTLLFIVLITFILNILFEYGGNKLIEKIFLKNSIFAPLIASLVGLIPNCGASVILSELYVSGAISIASLISGLLTGSGVALLVLFKSNKNIKENFSILGLVYLIGVIVGLFLEIIDFAL